MKTAKRFIALTELFLLFSGALFMTALFVRNIQPSQRWFIEAASMVAAGILFIVGLHVITD